jgi:hypothetical protein
MKKSINKLSLKRSTLTNLSQAEQGEVKGGEIVSGTIINPSNQFTCQSHLWTECCFPNTRFLCVTRNCPIQPL